MKLDWVWGAMNGAVGADEEWAEVRVQGALNTGYRLPSWAFSTLLGPDSMSALPSFHFEFAWTTSNVHEAVGSVCE